VIEVYLGGQARGKLPNGPGGGNYAESH
jgi:hypothetical protein